MSPLSKILNIRQYVDGLAIFLFPVMIFSGRPFWFDALSRTEQSFFYGVVKFPLLNVRLTSVKAKVFWPDIIHFNIVVEIWLKTYDKANKYESCL